MKENVIVEEYDFGNPLFQKVDSIIDNCIRDWHDKYYHTFDHICEYNLIFTNTSNNVSVNFKISDKCMGMYELDQKLAKTRGNGFIFNHINKLTEKIYCNLCHVNIHYYLKLRIPMGQRLFFRRIAQNRDYVQIFCNDRRNPFHFACRQWYSYNNPQF